LVTPRAKIDGKYRSMSASVFPVENVPFGIISTSENVSNTFDVKSSINLLLIQPNPRPAAIIQDTVLISLFWSGTTFSIQPPIIHLLNVSPHQHLKGLAALPKEVRSAVLKHSKMLGKAESCRKSSVVL
jgi:hypothetical protein